MAGQVLLVVLGFALTTVAGGFLGYWFQRRSWNATRREAERQAAVSAYEEISRLMDKRIYRKLRWLWSLKPGVAPADRQSARAEYGSLLREWNDTLNRNLALAQRYFGPEVGDYVDRVVYEEFKRLGQRVEELARRRFAGDVASACDVVEAEIKALSDEVYQLNRFVIMLVQRGEIGLYYPRSRRWRRPVRWSEQPPWDVVLKRGSYGPSVAAWQRALDAVCGADLDVDGTFGPRTAIATRGFQRTSGLSGDCVVDRETREIMNGRLPPLRRPSW